MSEPMLIRVFVVCFWLLTSLPLFLLWRNAGAPDASKNAAILVAAFVPFLIGVLTYWKSETVEHTYTFVLLYDSERNFFVLGEEFGDYGIYNQRYGQLYTNLAAIKPDALKASDLTEAMGAKGFDIVEKGIVQDLLWRFLSDWNLSYTKTDTPIGTGFYIHGRGELPITQITLVDLQRTFAENSLINTPGVMMTMTGFLAVPRNTRISAGATPHSRSIVFDSPSFTINITVKPNMGGLLQHDIFGVLHIDPRSQNRYKAITSDL